MTDRNASPPRRVAIPDHLWQLFEEMSGKMGTERDGLVCQAMYVFARLNGFIDAAPISATLSSMAAAHAAAPAAGGSNAAVAGPSGSAEPTGPMPTTAPMSVSVSDDTAAMPPRTPTPPPPEPPQPAERGQLYVLTDAGDLDPVAKERFVIGRGKHCDFIIHSGKVSREHAVVVREDADWFIEDLGSSNGTWFNKQRVKRRRVEDGDEYYICNEKIKFVLR